MLRSYVGTAVRRLARNPLYALLNLIGLSIAVAAIAVVVPYAQRELSYDRDHPDVDRIYRVLREYGQGGTRLTEEGVSGSLVPEMRASFPDIEACLRWVPREVWVRSGERVVRQVMVQTEAPALEFFNIPLASGSKEAFYNTGQTVFVTERLAQRLFGTENPMGRSLTIEGTPYAGDYIIRGILKDPPGNSTLVYDLIMSETGAVNVHRSYGRWIGSGTSPVHVYLKLRRDASTTRAQEMLHDALSRNIDPALARQSRYHLQPFTRIYLHSRADFGMEIQTFRAAWTRLGDIRQVRIAVLVAGSILLIAAVNLTNLSLSQALCRGREVGIRKAVGARRNQIIYQFLAEAGLLSAASVVTGLVIADLSMPYISGLLDTDLDPVAPYDPTFLIATGGVACLTGLLSGLYPSLLLSSLSSTSAMRETRGPSGGAVRKGLVVVQFAAAAGLILGSVVLRQQMDYVESKDLGFDREQMVVVPLFWEARHVAHHGDYGIALKNRLQDVKQAFLDHPNVLRAGVSRYYLQEFVPYKEMRPQGSAAPWRVRTMSVDDGFFGTLDIKTVKGNVFSTSYASVFEKNRPDRGIAEQFVVNEAAARQLGWDDPIGKQMGWHKGSGKPGTVVGVVKDFHVQTLHAPVEPVIFEVSHLNLKHLLLKIRGERVRETLDHIEAVWERFLPTRPFTFEFLDDRIDSYYRAETNRTVVFQTFAVLAIFVSCLGLFGLSCCMAAVRSKEMGIRKAVGGSTVVLVSMVAWEFTKIILIANLIALPITWWATRSWLDGFAYRVDLTAIPFLGVGLLTIAIALATVSSQIWRVCGVNPVEALRQE